MDRAKLASSKVDGLLFWQCVCICANPARYAPKPIERVFLQRVIRAYRSGRRLRNTVHSVARGIVRACKERGRIGSCSRPEPVAPFESART